MNKNSEAEGRDDCGLMDVVKSYWDLMVTLVEVDLIEDCLPRQVGVEVHNVTDGEAVIFVIELSRISRGKLPGLAGAQMPMRSSSGKQSPA